jgi:uncharacterized protein
MRFTVINVSLVYSPSEEAPLFQTHLQVTPGATVEDALRIAGFYEKYPQAQSYSIGIYSKLVTLEHKLSSGDRIEIYRPLQLDPKQARRKRAGKS